MGLMTRLMAQFDDVVYIFHLAQLNRCASIGLYAVNASRVGANPVDGDRAVKLACPASVAAKSIRFSDDLFLLTRKE